MEQKETAQIVDRVLKGDRQAYALLVKQYQAQIYNLALRMTANAHDAADLTQETFIRAYVHLWRYNPQKKFFTWLYTIALNIIRNYFKKEKSNKTSAQKNINQPVHDYPSPEGKLAETGEIGYALSRLDVDTRALIIMKYQEELSFEEIARISGKTISAVKMRIYRGLEKLKKIMS